VTAHRFTTAHKNRARLNVQALEGREVPASLIDLTSHGATATASGAILSQADPVASNKFLTFLSLDANGSEAGYNTDNHPFHMDQQGGSGTTHALKLSTVPKVVVGGVTYREFILEVNQKSNHSTISLDELRMFVGNDRKLWGYNSGNHTLGGKTAVFDLDHAKNVSVKLNAKLNAGHGKGDAVVLVPDSVFGSSTYVFLFSKFSDANGGSEQWGVRKPSSAPAPSQGATISGNVFADMNGDGTREPNGTTADPTEEPGLQGVTVQIEFTNAQGQTTTKTATTDSNGNYSFTGLTAGTYTITVSDPDGFMIGATTSYTVTLASSTNATGYNFAELPIMNNS
jgi:SdrD B-like domain